MNLEDYKIKRADLITIIGGVQRGEDKSTASRNINNFAVIEASERQENIYKALFITLNKCLSKVGSGVRLNVIDKIARESIIEADYGQYGYWQFNEPLVWAMFDRWRNIDNPDLSEFILKENNIVAIEPSLKLPSINAYCLTGELSNPVVQDLVKVGATIAVTNNSYRFIGPEPEESLRIIGVEK